MRLSSLAVPALAAALSLIVAAQAQAQPDRGRTGLSDMQGWWGVTGEDPQGWTSRIFHISAANDRLRMLIGKHSPRQRQLFLQPQGPDSFRCTSEGLYGLNSVCRLTVVGPGRAKLSMGKPGEAPDLNLVWLKPIGLHSDPPPGYRVELGDMAGSWAVAGQDPQAQGSQVFQINVAADHLRLRGRHPLRPAQLVLRRDGLDKFHCAAGKLFELKADCVLTVTGPSRAKLSLGKAGAATDFDIVRLK